MVAVSARFSAAFQTKEGCGVLCFSCIYLHGEPVTFEWIKNLIDKKILVEIKDYFETKTEIFGYHFQQYFKSVEKSWINPNIHQVLSQSCKLLPHCGTYR